MCIRGFARASKLRRYPIHCGSSLSMLRDSRSTRNRLHSANLTGNDESPQPCACSTCSCLQFPIAVGSAFNGTFWSHSSVICANVGVNNRSGKNVGDRSLGIEYDSLSLPTKQEPRARTVHTLYCGTRHKWWQRDRGTSITYTEPTYNRPSPQRDIGWVRSLLLHDESCGLASQMKRCAHVCGPQ